MSDRCQGLLRLHTC